MGSLGAGPQTAQVFKGYKEDGRLDVGKHVGDLTEGRHCSSTARWDKVFQRIIQDGLVGIQRLDSDSLYTATILWALHLLEMQISILPLSSSSGHKFSSSRSTTCFLQHQLQEDTKQVFTGTRSGLSGFPPPPSCSGCSPPPTH